MAAYVVADTTSVQDQATYDEYRRKVMPTLAKHGAKFLVRGGKHEVKEGNWHPTRLVIIEFPSLAAAEAWYSDPEYVPLLELRRDACKHDLLFVEGV